MTSAEPDRSRPYPGRVHADAHPLRLVTVATLFGHSGRCEGIKTRVLEIGCGDGQTACWIASTLDCDVYAYDIDENAVARARARAKACGLRNVHFEVRDFKATPVDDMKFDVVICHGLLSWVDEPSRQTLVAVIAEHLAPGGLAYVSYNVKPGWHLHSITRDLLRYLACDRPVPRRNEVVDDAMMFLEQASIAVLQIDPLWSRILDQELMQVRGKPLAYLEQEHLAPVTHPMLLSDVVTLASERGLSYVGDSRLYDVFPVGLSVSDVSSSGLLAGVAAANVQGQQLLDFVRGTSFRRSIFTRPPESAARSTAFALENMYVRWRLPDALLSGVATAAVETPVAHFVISEDRVVSLCAELWAQEGRHLAVGELMHRFEVSLSEIAILDALEAVELSVSDRVIHLPSKG